MAPPPHDPYLKGQQSRAAPHSMATTLDGKDRTGPIRAFVSSIGITCRRAPSHWGHYDGFRSRGGATRRPFAWSWCLASGSTCTHPLKPNSEAHAPEAGWIAAVIVLTPEGACRPGPPRQGATEAAQPRVRSAHDANLYTGPRIGYIVGIYGRPQRRLSRGS